MSVFEPGNSIIVTERCILHCSHCLICTISFLFTAVRVKHYTGRTKYLPTYLPTNLLTYQPTYLPTYQEQAQSTITKKNLPLKGENKEFGTETFIITGSLIVRDNRPCRVLLRFKSWDKIQH